MWCIKYIGGLESSYETIISTIYSVTPKTNERVNISRKKGLVWNWRRPKDIRQYFIFKYFFIRGPWHYILLKSMFCCVLPFLFFEVKAFSKKIWFCFPNDSEILLYSVFSQVTQYYSCCHEFSPITLFDISNGK